jgi:cytochrome c-type biogenesis protein CcmH
VLYDPPVQPGTWLLWFGPLLILLAGAAVVAVNVRRRSRAARAAADASMPDDIATDRTGDDW